MSTTSQETVDARAWCIGNLKATKSMQQIQIYMEICQEWVKAAKMLQDPSSRSGIWAFAWGSLLLQSTLLLIWLTSAALHFACHQCISLCPEVRRPSLLIVDPGCILTLSIFHFGCFLSCLAWPVGGLPTVGLTLRGTAHFADLQCLYKFPPQPSESCTAKSISNCFTASSKLWHFKLCQFCFVSLTLNYM